jgi:hypothetical protein
VFGVDFQEDVIYEVILSTTRFNKPFVAPIGVTYKNGAFEAKLYRNTVTYQNLTLNPFGAIIIVNDGLTFYKASYEKRKLLSNMQSYQSFWFLKEATAWIGFKVTSEEKEAKQERSVLRLSPVLGSLLQTKPAAYSRVDSALVEMLIHSSRLKPYIEAGMFKEVSELYGLIMHYHSLIGRIAPGSEYEKFSAIIFRRASELMREC